MQKPHELKLDALIQPYLNAAEQLQHERTVPTELQEQRAAQKSEEEFTQQLNNEKRKAIHWLWVGLTWFSGILLTIVSLVIVWHWIAPSAWRWLSKEDMCTLTNYFAACGGGIMMRSVASKI